ncbi:MAG: hypothetical protein AAGC91_11910 [Pseudomonadota bacterium]
MNKYESSRTPFGTKQPLSIVVPGSRDLVSRRLEGPANLTATARDGEFQSIWENRLYYRAWTTAGACGKKEHHFDQRQAAPKDDPHGRIAFGLALGDVATTFHVFGDRYAGSGSIFVPESLATTDDKRLSVVTRDGLRENGGDNSGSYQLVVIVDSSNASRNLTKSSQPIARSSRQRCSTPR